MTSVASRDLRNHTAEVLRRVRDGGSVTVTVHGAPVAEIIPVRPARPASMGVAELSRVLGTAQADPALRGDLARLAGDTTDDLGAPR